MIKKMMMMAVVLMATTAVAMAETPEQLTQTTSGTSEVVLVTQPLNYLMPADPVRSVRSTNTAVAEPLLRHNVWGSFGVLSLPDMVSLASSMFASVFSIWGGYLLVWNPVVNYNLGYEYSFNKIFSVGGNYSFCPAHSLVTKSSDGQLVPRQTVHFNFSTFMVAARINYFTKPSFKIYGRVSVGVSILDSYNKYADPNNAGQENEAILGIPMMQISPIGFEWGRKLGFFVEGGFGAHGLLMAGLKYSF